MKVLKSKALSPFGGLNFVLEEFTNLGLESLLRQYLPALANQSQYSWKDIFFTYWALFFCGGDCAEDVEINLRPVLSNNPFLSVPSADRLLERLKNLATPVDKVLKKRSKVVNELSYNDKMNALNIKLLKRLKAFKVKNLVLDYDNTFVYTQKSDAKRTYTKHFGYCPGVGLIGNKVVYVENRNGNCAPHNLQEDTLERMFLLLKDNQIEIKSFRADAASYRFVTINTVNKHVDKFYIRATVNDRVCEAINKITEWKKIKVDDSIYLRGSVLFTPFTNTARRLKQKHLLKEYRLVVTKEARRDGQLNLFTGEAYNYSPILTNDFDKTDDEVVIFYNQRGKEEREFDVLKNDFGWNKLPFSKMEQNTVFLIMAAMGRNLYDYIIHEFSTRYKNLKPNFRIKKFIFRFVCIPAKWVRTGREIKLRLYGSIPT
ncbi:IS1380 family transposase [Maribellus comscasis]|uniref:IS1380 family transposase n=1 Tax=Maribellus comscasis TaxID=2681766 RepID=A0A6I6K5V5_9BACT|nr:IS1380 family transposase [Maribellus comscasis]QGY43471.1 IS1380 family transposase [Maribellus comscasis]QGY47862.1 IS1380 family transposase [Maribellus comscasis]